MNNKNFEVYFDCGSSKIRAGVFDKKNVKNNFYLESKFFFTHLDIKSEIEKIISSLEKDTNQYLDSINLMIDSDKMLSVGISISKKLDGSILKKEDIQFLIQDAKQQLLRDHADKSVTHIIIKKYIINNKSHSFLPDNINCNLISLDINFIFLPKIIIEFYKKLFSKFDISIDQIICTSYAKSINYKDNFPLIENISFIDIGFNKTSITHYYKNDFLFLNTLLIGSNNITKDISQVLKVDLNDAENLKFNFDKNKKLLDEKKILPNLIQEVIFARIEEILELSIKSIRLNLNSSKLNQYKMVLTGEGSKILNNKFKEKISFLYDIDLLDETTEDICESGFKLGEGLNPQEVVMIPKKPIKSGFFERLFHIFE